MNLGESSSLGSWSAFVGKTISKSKRSYNFSRNLFRPSKIFLATSISFSGIAHSSMRSDLIAEIFFSLSSIINMLIIINDLSVVSIFLSNHSSERKKRHNHNNCLDIPPLNHLQKLEVSFPHDYHTL